MGSELAIFDSQTRLSVSAWAALYWFLGQSCLLGIPKQPRLRLGQKIALWKMTIGPHCGGQDLYHTVLCEQREIELLPVRSLHHYLFGKGRYSACYWRRNLDNNPVTKTSTYDLSFLQVVGQWWFRTGSDQTKIWFNLRPMPWEGTNAWQCLDSQSRD